MKKYCLLIILIVFVYAIKAQAPQHISYQFQIKDLNGSLLMNQNIGLRISIIENAFNGPPVFIETHNILTDEHGIVNVIIGHGSITLGSIEAIQWQANLFFLQIETDVSGGTNYSLMGASQLISVPYALYGRDLDYSVINELQHIEMINDTIWITKDSSYIPNEILENIGEVKMFAISVTGSVSINSLKDEGWAICDGTSAISQGISDAILFITPDLRNKFIRMSNNNSSGETGGTETHDHGGQTGYFRQSNASRTSYQSTLSHGHDHPIYSDNHLPPYTEMLFFIKVK